jgi:hypothetical protein
MDSIGVLKSDLSPDLIGTKDLCISLGETPQFRDSPPMRLDTWTRRT